MPTLQRTCTVKMPVDQAEQTWNKFTSQQGQQDAPKAGSGQGDGQDPGTVYFNEADNGQTEVTIQLNPEGIADGDEQSLNQRVDGYLVKFKQFVESQ